MEDLHIHGRIILKQILKKQDRLDSSGSGYTNSRYT